MKTHFFVFAIVVFILCSCNTSKNNSFSLQDETIKTMEYKSETTPELLENTTTIITNGIIEEGDDTYYLENGQKVTGWKVIGNYWHYFEPEEAIGWRQIDGKWYYFLKNGHMCIGMITIDGKVYYFDSDGHMIFSETRQIYGEMYTFDANGVGIKSEKETEKQQETKKEEIGCLSWDDGTQIIVEPKLPYEFINDSYYNKGKVLFNIIQMRKTDYTDGSYLETDFTMTCNQIGGYGSPHVYYRLYDEEGFIIDSGSISVGTGSIMQGENYKGTDKWIGYHKIKRGNTYKLSFAGEETLFGTHLR